MIALQLTNTKNFMNALLCTELFDHFLLKEATIAAGATYTIDGAMPREYYTAEEAKELGIEGEAYLPYSLLRGNCHELIKGKKTPSYLSFVFLLSKENMARTLASISDTFTMNDVSALFVNIRFQNGKLTLTTGISYQMFSLDKSLDEQWDRLIQKFLAKHEIEFEPLV